MHDSQKPLPPLSNFVQCAVSVQCAKDVRTQCVPDDTGGSMVAIRLPGGESGQGSQVLGHSTDCSRGMRATMVS